MPEFDELSLRVLRLLSARPPGTGCEVLVVEGESPEAVSAIVERLRFDHLVDAEFEPGAGPTPGHWAPSVLTSKGRRVLASLDGVVCPTCFQPMRLVNDSGDKLFECATHGQWLLNPSSGSLRRTSDAG